MDEQKINFSSSINDALQGSMDAYEFLYRKSLPIFSKQVREYCSNPADVEDILQEAYIKIFTHLGTLKNASNFLAWGRQICRREAINAGKSHQAKKHDYVLMPEITEDEGTMGLDEIPADTYSFAFNPEAKVDAEETRRLMDEMLGELSENQQLVIGMWKDQYTFKEIAEELDMPESTVRSHFSRGKKALEAKVKDLEKQGTKLYGMAPFVFFLWLLGQFEQSDTPEVVPKAAQDLLSRIVDRLPDAAISVHHSTPRSIETYGNEALRRQAEAARHGPERDRYPFDRGRKQNPEAYDEYEETRSESPQLTKDQEPNAFTPEDGGQSHPGYAAALAGRTAARMRPVMRGILVAAVVVVIGIGVLVGYRFLSNRQEPEVGANKPVGTDEPLDVVAEPVFTLEEAANMTVPELATALNMNYIGNVFDESATEISTLPEGCISAYVHDFDGDAENEVLVVKSASLSGSQAIGISMFELEGDIWIESANRMEFIPDWDSIKVKAEPDGWIDSTQVFTYHVVNNTIYISSPGLYNYFYESYDYDLAGAMVTYDGTSFQEERTTNFLKEDVFRQGGFCLATAIYSYFSTDRLYDPGDFAQSYLVSLVDYTDMPSYTVGNYEFSYPKYYDQIGVQLETGKTQTGHDAVTANLFNENIHFPEDYEGVQEGCFLLFYMYSGNGSEDDYYAMDAATFWENGDVYWGFSGGENEGDNYAVYAMLTEENVRILPQFHEYYIIYYTCPEIGCYFHPLGN